MREWILALTFIGMCGLILLAIFRVQELEREVQWYKTAQKSMIKALETDWMETEICRAEKELGR